MERKIDYISRSPYDLSQVRRQSQRRAAPGSTRPLTDDPYSATTVVNTEKRGVRMEETGNRNMTKDEEIRYLKSVIYKHLKPFLAEGEMDVGPGVSYWYCPICQETAYWDVNKIDHKTDCHWKKEKYNG